MSLKNINNTNNWILVEIEENDVFFIPCRYHRSLSTKIMKQKRYKQKLENKKIELNKKCNNII
jgi:hypothetical protein|tara:strand:- start:1229 stop:1417 length:189 start_codon:yes stop_codon:yes gene_type:complete